MTGLNGRVPLIGQGMTREQAMKVKLLQQLNSLSLSIYAHCAKDYIRMLEHVDVEKLKGMARNSRMAAEAYFEGLGIIQK
jgi:hypothetical protein